MFIDIRKKDFNWFSNPYISPNIYEIDETWKLTPSKNIKFQLCDQEQTAKYVHDMSFYPNAICFADKTQLKLYSNWNQAQFRNIIISFDYCD